MCPFSATLLSDYVQSLWSETSSFDPTCEVDISSKLKILLRLYEKWAFPIPWIKHPRQWGCFVIQQNGIMLIICLQSGFVHSRLYALNLNQNSQRLKLESQ